MGNCLQFFFVGLCDTCPPSQTFSPRLFSEAGGPGAWAWGRSNSLPTQLFHFFLRERASQPFSQCQSVSWFPRPRLPTGCCFSPQELERETRRLSYKGRGGRAPAEALAWNDAAWEVPWHNMVGEVCILV